MTVIDPAFEGAGQTPGLTIWRIEQLEVKPIAKQHYGTFFTGDAYIVLHTRQLKSGRLEWNIHFWLGAQSSQDEGGVAAIKTVELDDLLGGSPVQHREVQDHESKLFLSYFKQGIRYLEGGVASGFRHVEDETTKRLLHVKGRRNVRVHEVPAKVDSMNHGDCFILDTGTTIYVWVGESSGRMERIKAIQAANGVRDDLHGGRSAIVIIDASSSSAERQQFYDALGGGSDGDVKPAAEGASDDIQHEAASQLVLYKFWNEGGQMNEEKVSERPLKRATLDSGSCYLLDAGTSGIYVWVGKEADKLERSQSMKMAQDYLAKRGYPNWVTVTRVIEDAEPPLFKQFFAQWTEPEYMLNLKRLADAEPEFDVKSLHRAKRRLLAKNLGKACGFLPDDGSGEVEIWRVENFELAPVDRAAYGMFFGGDSYVIKYSYGKGGPFRYIIYFWQGRTSSQDEKAASALWAVKLDNDLAGKAVQVRVVHGAEPEHFLRIFKGKMIIFSGGHASGFRNVHDYDSYDVDGTRMFQIRGTNEFNTRAEQVPEKASSLNSDDVFVVETPSVTYVWFGKDSSEEERTMAKNIVALVSPEREVMEVAEGEEPPEFWNSIGGKGDYLKSRPDLDRPMLEPRLFKCSDSSGRFRVEEICNFDMEDLCEDDVMVLDSGDEIYVWIGNGSTEEERKQSLKMAEDYLQTDPTDRGPENTVIITVKQGEEPLGFTSLFPAWNPSFWQTSTHL